MWATKLLTCLALLMAAIAIARLDTQMPDNPDYNSLCFFIANFELEMVGSDRCVGTVKRYTRCAGFLLGDRIDRIYAYIKANANDTYQKACSKSTVNEHCSVGYVNLTVQPTDQMVLDPVTGQQVHGCKWSGKEAPLTCNGRDPINSSAISAFERADVMPYFTVINDAPIICDAPVPPPLVH